MTTVLVKVKTLPFEFVIYPFLCDFISIAFYLFPYHWLVMPSKAALFDAKNCDMVFDFGVSHRNTALYNPHGNNILLFIHFW